MQIMSLSPTPKSRPGFCCSLGQLLSLIWSSASAVHREWCFMAPTSKKKKMKTSGITFLSCYTCWYSILCINRPLVLSAYSQMWLRSWHLFTWLNKKLSVFGDCRVDSVVKSNCCFSRGPWFDSQHLHGKSEPSVYSSSRGSNALFWPDWTPGKHIIHKHTCRQNNSYTQNKSLKKFF